MDPYKMFGTDADLEKNGIKLDYGTFFIIIGRAGGANKKFSNLLAAKMKPHRRAIQTDTLDDKVAEKLVLEAYSEGVIFGWGYYEFGENDAIKTVHTGLFPSEDGGTLEFNRENVIKVMTALPDLFRDVKEQAEKVSLFRKEVVEADAGNSAPSSATL